MDLEIAEEASQLLRKKITLEQDLEKILTNTRKFVIGTQQYTKDISLYVTPTIDELSINKNEEFNKKLKWLTILEVEKEIEKITNQIKDLKYK